MKILYRHLQAIQLRDILLALHDQCKPNQKHVKSDFESQSIQRRNAVFLLVQLLAFISSLIHFLAGIGEWQTHLNKCIGTALIITISLILFRFHPQVFKSFYNFYVLAYQAFISSDENQGIHLAWQVTLAFPGFVYLATGSIWHSIFNTLMQLIFINTLYQRPMNRSLSSLHPEAFLNSLTKSTQEIILFSAVSMLITHVFIKDADQKAHIAKQSKNEVERQKNFLLGFSHELRNLLNSLIGNIKLVGLEITTVKAKDLILNAEVCSELLLHLVNNILDTGKAEVGDLEINSSSIRIYDTMERIWCVCSELIKRKDLQGAFKMNRNVPQVLCLDHYRFMQILLNLVQNAVKFTNQGRVDVNVELIPNKESVTEDCFEPHPFDTLNEGIFEKNQAMSNIRKDCVTSNFISRNFSQEELPTVVNERKAVLKIIVSDTGVGMSQEVVGKLFQKFKHVTSDHSRRRLGTGLGLFVTKELCRRMGGDIKVYSREGKGSVFIFCLPVKPAMKRQTLLVNSKSAMDLISRRQPTALVVDDQDFSSNILKVFLEKLNVKVTDVAQNGLEAYQKFASLVSANKSPDIVTMDLDMPIMDGKTASQKIRELEREKGLIPCLLIIVSGNCSQSEIDQCIDQNGEVKADVFLKKPVNINELSRIISSHLLKRER